VIAYLDRVLSLIFTLLLATVAIFAMMHSVPVPVHVHPRGHDRGRNAQHPGQVRACRPDLAAVLQVALQLMHAI